MHQRAGAGDAVQRLAEGVALLVVIVADDIGLEGIAADGAAEVFGQAGVAQREFMQDAAAAGVFLVTVHEERHATE